MKIICLIMLYLTMACNTAEATSPSIDDKLAEAAKNNSYSINYTDGNFSGSGWDLLIKEGESSQFFLLGEEHGIAESPKLASALFKAFIPFGYSKFAVEASPHMTTEMEKAAEKGINGIKKMFEKDSSKMAFFGMREEAEMIVEIVENSLVAPGSLWGLDYEVMADRHLISILETKNKSEFAELRLSELKQASNKSWGKFYETKNPQYIFSFSGDPSLITSLRNAWSEADSEAVSIMNTLEKTLTINQLFVSGKSWESNYQRASLIKENFIKYWNTIPKESKVFFKMGSSHLIRGRSNSEVYDIGNLLPEIATLNGKKSFNLKILPGHGSSTAVFDPTKLKYFKGPPKDNYSNGLEVITQSVSKDNFTLIDLRPLRKIMSWQHTQNVELNRVIHGFDALLILTKSTASKDLFEAN